LKTLTYQQAITIVRENLNSTRNLHKWAKSNNLNYKVALEIKNNRDKKVYPNYLQACLEAFGYEVTHIEKNYIFHVKSHF
jgi:hypothetical protein